MAIIELNGGDEAWRMWKTQQAERLLELVTHAPRRLSVFRLDLTSDFRAVINLCAPMPMDTGRHSHVDRAAITASSVIEVHCPQTVLDSPIACDQWLSIIHPAHDLLHPHIGDGPQYLWTGHTVTSQANLADLVVAAWSVITMQPGLGFRAPGGPGVLNQHAADYWLTQTHRLPLLGDNDFSDSPFLRGLVSRPRR